MPLRSTRRTALAGLAAGGFGLAHRPGAAGAQPPAPAELIREAGVVSGSVDGQDLKVDIARLPAPAGALRPAAIVIHGGGMRKDLEPTCSASICPSRGPDT